MTPPGMRSAALLLLGVWLGLLMASWALAPATFRTVERVLAAPETAARLAPVAEEDRRTVLRYLAAEVNRWMFGSWAVVQIVLSAVVVALTWRVGGASRWIALAALAVVAGQSFGLVPAIRDLGRAVDFAPRPLPPAVGGRFGTLHGAYAVVDLAKAALVAVLAWLVARS
jgi:hypothetical protein